MSLPENPSKLNLHSPLFFIGFMGCGKTTIGKKISKKSGIPFIDLDEQIVEKSGISIADYFALHGENLFRQLESDTLRAIPAHQAQIISTGGGAPCFNNNMDWMNKNGITIYLKLPPTVLLKRLSGKEAASRPLLKEKNEKEMLDFITTRLNEREKFYQEAQLTISAFNMNPAQIIDLIAAKI